MDEAIAGCSSTPDSTVVNTNSDDGELSDLVQLESGINVWSEAQQVLEEQALRELDIFSQENNNAEEGEIIEDHKPEKIAQSLDINSYIKRQEELRKIQEHKRTLLVPNKSKLIADTINSKITSKQNNNGKKNKRKLKSDSETTLEKKLKVADDAVREKSGNTSGSEYFPSDCEENLDGDDDYCPETSNNELRTKRKKIIHNIDKVKDDGCPTSFKNRLEQYYKNLEDEVAHKDDDDEDPDHVDYYTIKKGLKIPLKIWNLLYGYQQDGVRWLWKIHQEITGGILGDEMGLGKTVQVIAFLSALEYSQVISMHGRCKGLGPTLIACPATVIHQWVKHFHDWAPEFRVAVLHQSGSYQGNKVKLIKEIHKSKGIIVTTYSGILKYKGNLAEHNWHYLILDEGHKIRNPNAKISIACKQIRTPHRLMLTGSPMQNNLQELWSLFDFTNPGILGNLMTFNEHFAQPIIAGGFINTTPMQEATALSVATTLKNLITPYLLRRTKSEVQDDISLPNKSEQVLFCSLSREQRDLYQGYLMSEHVGLILGRDSRNYYSENQMKANVLVAITTLRKICNHPDIYLCEADEDCPKDEVAVEDRFGFYKKSGKMIVVSALLKIWKKQNHRVLLFTQSRAMIVIFEEFLSQQGYKYLKMDGSTPVSSRQSLINKFNDDSTIDVFLLTTRVGGLGVNLTGADRVIIYDPDWNPATDTQARERAWRIGQDKQVTIYRLLSAGTIEEKMYQRQVWKQLLSNKVLVDPRTHRFFQSSGLHDLFSLPDYREDANPETTNIFRDSRVKLQERLKSENKSRKKKKSVNFDGDNGEVQFSEDKIQAMRNLAAQISKSIAAPPAKKEPERTSYQIELEEERLKKLEEKERLKKLTPVELMYLNREKANEKGDEESCNKVDDFDTNVSFSKALEYSEKTCELYHQLKEEKVVKISTPSTDNNDQSPPQNDNDDNSRRKRKKSKRKKREKERLEVADSSGIIEGEEVEGLVRSEVKKVDKKHEKEINNESHDRYILERLFSKKGVSGALQHDSVVEGNVKSHGLRIDAEAKKKADLALEALRKSRLKSWRW